MTATGFRLWPGYLDDGARRDLAEAVLDAVRNAPFLRPITPGGRPMSVEMTNLGPLGWVTDAAGYRYQGHHPLTGRPWPAMPPALMDIWRALAGTPADADCCLVNLYRGGARMGLHQDRDEADFSVPVLSISLGDTAVFRIGGASRSEPSRAIRLASGDVCLLGGEARLAFHGVDRVLAGSSRLIPGGGRLNLTLRRAAPAAGAQEGVAIAGRGLYPETRSPSRD
jgi:alkylated DNA repair protein (DNA oxidative demethylase)